MRTSYGRYALPLADPALVAASRLTATVSHTSAALFWGWAVKTPPGVPHVTVARHRSRPAARRTGALLHWRDLAPDEVVGAVTTPVRTVVDCCLDLPFDEALAVFDSALREGLPLREVHEAAIRLPARQRNRVQAVARRADPRAANPFESVLRAIASGVPGLTVMPQVTIGDDAFFARVDLADAELRIVLEADSFEFHGSRQALDLDARRYNGLIVRGWLVLRFSWEQVMVERELVAAVLRAAVALRRDRSTGTRGRSRAKTA